MLSPDDVALVARDTNLPGLPILFDNAAFANVLPSLCPDVNILAVTSEYVRYKPGVSCLMKYRVKTGNGNTEVYARAHPQDQTNKMSKAVEQTRVPGHFGFGAGVVDEHALVVYEFPNDHEMPVVRRIGDPVEQPKLLERVLPKRPDLWNTTTVKLRYKPERRYAARLESDNGIPLAILKICTESEFERAYANSRLFVSEGSLHIPARIGRSRRHNILVYEWLAGKESYREAIDPSQAKAIGRQIGVAAAIMHTQQTDYKLNYTSEVMTGLVQDAAATISLVSALSGERAGELARQLVKAGKNITLQRQSIHGDFSLDQTLMVNDGIAVVDFDRAGCGDGAMDLGKFCADLFLLSINEQMSSDARESMTIGLLNGYEFQTGSVDPKRIDLFEAISLMQLAIEPFRYRHPQWEKAMETILNRVESLVNHA